MAAEAVLAGAEAALDAVVPVVLELAAGATEDFVTDGTAFALVTGGLLELGVTLAGVFVAATVADFVVAVLVLELLEVAVTAGVDFVLAVAALDLAEPAATEAGLVTVEGVSLPPDTGGLTWMVETGAPFGLGTVEVLGADVNKEGAGAAAILVTVAVGGGPFGT